MVGIKTDVSVEEKLKLSSQLVSVEQCPDLLPEDFIYHTKNRGRTVPIFKILLSNICYNDCLYCANRSTRNCKRYKFRVAEVVNVFMELYSQGKVSGIFLSSGIHNRPDRVQAEILKVVEILRKKYRYSGYIHSKVIPGSDPEIVRALFEFSDRVSINLEAPGERYIRKIAPHKDFLKLYTRLKQLVQFSKEYNLNSGITTQLIVGIGDEDDRTLLSFAHRLYTQIGIRRMYYSGFQPVEATPLEGKSRCRKLRILRLYQADYLIRMYGFSPQEFAYDDSGNLLLSKDPKLAWAEKNLIKVNINNARFEELIRIPGIGHNSAREILLLRKKKRIKLSDLKNLGINRYQTLKFIQT